MRPPRTPHTLRSPLRPLAALAALALGLAAFPVAAASWEHGPSDDPRWQRVRQAGLGLAASPAPGEGTRGPAAQASSGSETRSAWRREWRLIENRLLSLGALPAAFSVDTHAAFREALAAGRAPARFAPDGGRERLRVAGPPGHAGPYVAIRSGGARRALAGWQRLHVWAEGAGYAVGRRSAGYGLECGAALALDEDVDLTAGYRLAGYTLGATLEAELDDVEDRIGTPFVGLDFRF